MKSARTHRIGTKGRFELASLELRRLLATWAPLEGGEWVIRGTDRSDRFTLEVDPDRTSMAILRNGAQILQKARLRDLRSIRIDARGGNDAVLVSLPRRTNSIRVQVDGGWGHDTLIGGGADDLLLGGLGNDLLQGRDGHDSLDGGHGNDTLNGEAGNDVLRGKLGNDEIDGGAGRDDLDGGRDDDSLQGAGARDSLRGSDGADHLDGGTGRDVLAGGRGDDQIVRQAGRDTVSDSTATLRSPSEVARLGHTAESQFVQTLIDRAVSQYRWYFDHLDDYGTVSGQLLTRDYATFSQAFKATANTSFDTTNVQEAGVDEADRIETDGRYLYSIDGDELRILDLADPDNMSVRSTTAIGGNTMGIYLLEGGRLVVLSNQFASTGEGYLVQGWGTIASVRVTTYDVSNVDAPVELGHTDLDGYYIDSRVIGNSVYLVTGQTLNVSPQRTMVGDTYDNENEAEFRARLAGDLSWLPDFKSSRNGTEVAHGAVLTAENTHLVNGPNGGFNFASVTVIDGRNAGTGPADITNVDGRWVTEVYASQTAIYLAGATWNSSADDATAITKLAITESTVDIEATGVITGSLNNQFSLDEEGGLLRAAVTRGAGLNASNAVVVLETRGDTLETVGEVSGIAPGERIYSTRFVGDKAYVVTFRQVDPFYVIDLSNPAAPVVAGELKIPGVSNYLQPINDRHVLGIGQGGNENGQLQGVQVSLFDVADPANPLRVSTLTLESDVPWATSAAMYDHHAVQYFADEGILSLPLSGSEHATQQLVRVDLGEGALSLQDETAMGNLNDTRSIKLGDTIFATDGNVISTYNLEEGRAGETLNFNPQPNAIVFHCGWGWWFNGRGGTID